MPILAISIIAIVIILGIILSFKLGGLEPIECVLDILGDVFDIFGD